jgi:transposase
MAPPTRNQLFRTSSPDPLYDKEATTRKKCKFFDALARSGSTKSLRRIAQDAKISEHCARNWKKEYTEKGDLAKRRKRPTSMVLGRKSRVSKATC